MQATWLSATSGWKVAPLGRQKLGSLSPSYRSFAACVALAAARRQLGGLSEVEEKPKQAPKSTKASGNLELAALEVGQTLKGRVVQIYHPIGISVDVGCKDTLGFLEVEEFKDGFPDDGPFSFKLGDPVTVRVLDIHPDATTDHLGSSDPHGDYGDSGRLHLTMRSGDLSRPPRYIADVSRPISLSPFLAIPPDEWLEGEVVTMSNWALYINVLAEKKPFVGILRKEHFAEGFADQVVRGCKARVRILEVDQQCRRLLLTMRDPEPAR